MKRANRLMLTVGVALAALSFVAVLAFGGFGALNGTAKDPDVSAVVAAADLTLGAQVTVAQLTTRSKKQSEAAGTYLRAPADAQSPTVDKTGITLRELVDQYGVLPPAPVSPANP